MQGGRLFRAEPLDSTPWPWTAWTPAPALVCCPVPVAAMGVSPTAVADLYRRAYEAALSAARPSRYELALFASLN